VCRTCPFVPPGGPRTCRAGGLDECVHLARYRQVMTMRYSLNLPADVGDRDAQVVTRILRDAVTSHGVRRPAFSAPSLSKLVDSTDGQVTLYFEVLAEDEAELRAALATIVDVLQGRGLVLTDDPSILSERPETTPTSRLPGVQYDGDRQLLEIQTWAPDQHDLEIGLVQGSRPDEVVALLASTDALGRTEESFVVRQLRIGRPAGPGSLDKPAG
jgi:hypothetical protein